MREEYKEKLPSWYNDENGKYETIMTDDIDSLLGCTILKDIKGWNIEQCMLFKSLNENGILYDSLGVTDNSNKESVSVDYARLRGKTFDNHISRFRNNDYTNPDCINPNVIANISRENYFQKYAGSTVLLLWSLYDLPKENLDKELMLVLLAIDSTYKGFYDSRFQKWNRFYLCEILGLDCLYECEQRHQPKDFQDIATEYGLREKIRCNDGYLHTDIKIAALNDLLLWTDIQIELPKDKFHQKEIYQDKMKPITEKMGLSKCPDYLYSLAITNRSTVNYSVTIEKGE